MKRLLVLLFVLVFALTVAVPCYAAGFTPSVQKGKTAPEIISVGEETDPETGVTVRFVAEIVEFGESGISVKDRVSELYLFVTSYSDYMNDKFDEKMPDSTKVVVQQHLDEAYLQMLGADTFADLNATLSDKAKLLKPNYDSTIYRSSDLFEVSLISALDDEESQQDFMAMLADPNFALRVTFDLRMTDAEPNPVILHHLDRDSDLGNAGDWVLVADEDITRNRDEETGLSSLTVIFRDLCAIGFLRAKPDDEAIALRDAFGGEGKVIVTREDENSPFVVKLIDDVDQTVSIPAMYENIELDLNGHTIKGQNGTEEHPDGAPAIVFEAKENDTDPGTSITVSDSSPAGGGKIVGGDGAGDGKGGASIASAKDAPRAEVTLGEGTAVEGGKGTTGGDGVNGNISAKVEDGAIVKGGNGIDGTEENPHGGNGGAGLNCADAQITGGTIKGGNGGDGYGADGNGGNGGTAVVNPTYATSGELAGGNGGKGGTSGKGGNGGHGILVDKSRTEESIPVIKPGKTEEITITGGDGGNGAVGGDGGNGVRQDNATAVIDLDNDKLEVIGGKSGTGKDGETKQDAEGVVVIVDEPTTPGGTVINNYYEDGKCRCWFCAHWWILLIPMIIIILLLILVIILLLRRRHDDDEPEDPEPEEEPTPIPVVVADAADTEPAPNPAEEAPKAEVPAKKPDNEKLRLALLAGAAVAAWNIYIYRKFRKH